jgi:hypothetical protein
MTMLTKPLPNISDEIPNDDALIDVLGELFEVANAMCVYAQKTEMTREVRNRFDAIQSEIMFARRDLREKVM